MSYQIFVCACDKYSWIYQNFFRLANTNLPFPFVFFTEEYQDENENMIPIGKGSWNERMLRCLVKLQTRDVIYLQEDFLIRHVDESLLKEIYDFHKKYNACITKLGNNYEFKTYKYPARIGQHQVYIQDTNDEYLMSHQPVAIFNREFLMSTLSEKTPDASSHEIIGSKIMRINGHRKVFCIGEAHYPKNYSEIFHIEHAIRKGEVIADAIPYLTNVNNTR